MAVKPTQGQIDWTDGDAAKVLDPGAAKKLLGWVASERPPFKTMNFVLFVLDLWSKYFEEVTDTFVAQGLNYDAVIGVTGTHADFNAFNAAAILDSTLKRVLVVDPLTIAATQNLTVNDLHFVFKPQAVISQGASLALGINISGERVTFQGGRFINFDTGTDIALRLTAAAKNCHLNGCRFFLNDTDVDDLGSNNLLNVITEVP